MPADHAPTQEQYNELLAKNQALEAAMRSQYQRSVGLRDSQIRQAKIDAIRALADLAAEVEELAVNGVDPRIVVERVRGTVGAQDLEPISCAGTETAYDHRSHTVLIGTPRTGDLVIVLRPGYRWRSGQEDLVLVRAVVMPARP